MTSRAPFMARCCSNSLGTRASSTTVLLSSSRVAVVVPLDLLCSYRRTSSSHFSSPAGRSCSLHRSGTKICRRKMPCVFHHSEDPDDGPKRHSASRPDSAAQRTITKLSLSVEAKVQHGLVRSFPEHREQVLRPADRTVDRVLSFVKRLS